MSETRDESSRLQIGATWPPKGRTRRTVLGVAAATAAAGTIMVLSAAGGGGGVAGAAPADKITLCHRTDANNNPYRVITVSSNSVQHKILGPNGHGTHEGPVWNPTLKAQHIKWGDIIPPFDYGKGQHYPGLNWDATGIAIWENGCQIPGGTSSSAPASTPVTTPVTTPVSTPVTTPVTTPVSTPVTTPVTTVETTPVETNSVSISASQSHSQSHSASGGQSHSNSSSVAATSAAPIPAGVDAGLHTPIANAGLKAWGIVLMVLGGAAGLLAGLWPTRRRAH